MDDAGSARRARSSTTTAARRPSRPTRHAGLALVFELESLVGGSLRGRGHADQHRRRRRTSSTASRSCCRSRTTSSSLLDFTGRHERERTPQRHDRRPTDSGCARVCGGRPGLDAATMVVAGTAGFRHHAGEVVGVHVAWSGNRVLRVERDAATGTTVGGGELLLPGEVVLRPRRELRHPVGARRRGGRRPRRARGRWHDLPAVAPTRTRRHQPVVLNVWEAVFFDHDLDRLLAHRRPGAPASAWSGSCSTTAGSTDRRDDTAGLGDWWIDESVWPDGLTPLIEHVRGLGMEFGLWFEPEMVNPDSDLFRDAPGLDPAAGEARAPLLQRHQQVLDLTRPEVVDHLFDRVHVDALATHPIDYVKWDHNRDLLEAGTGARDGAPAVHAPDPGVLPAARPAARGAPGGRLGVVRVGRRPHRPRRPRAGAAGLDLRHDRRPGPPAIQRWTTQLVAPEYVGAHVSSRPPRTPPAGPSPSTSGPRPRSSARSASSGTSPRPPTAELDALADWIARYKRLRPLLHSGRVVRPESSRPGRAAARRRGGRPLSRRCWPTCARRARPQPRRPRPGARPRTGP